MQVLLSSSEGKTAPLQGPTLDLSSLASLELTDARRAMADKSVAASRSKNALSTLGVDGRASGEVHVQCNLYDMPCAPVRSVYTDVLYEAAQLQPEDDVWVFSALFGLTRAEDLIPAYRLNMSVTLPRLGRLSTFWKRKLASLEGEDDVYVNTRSTNYQVWSPSNNWWKTRVVDATGRAISHRAKHYRGLLTHALLDADSSDVIAVAEGIGRVSVEDGGTRLKILALTVK